MDIGALFLHRFDIAILERAVLHGLDNKPAPIELSIRPHRNLVIVFNEYLPADQASLAQAPSRSAAWTEGEKAATASSTPSQGAREPELDTGVLAAIMQLTRGR